MIFDVHDITGNLVENVDSWKDSDHDGRLKESAVLTRAPGDSDVGGPMTSS